MFEGVNANRSHPSRVSSRGCCVERKRCTQISRRTISGIRLILNHTNQTMLHGEGTSVKILQRSRLGAEAQALRSASFRNLVESNTVFVLLRFQTDTRENEDVCCLSRKLAFVFEAQTISGLCSSGSHSHMTACPSRS